MPWVQRYGSLEEWRILREAMPDLGCTRLLKRADRNIANSPLIEAVMTSQYGLPAQRCAVIPNMVIPGKKEDRAVARALLSLPAEARIALCVSNFHPGKNQMALIDAWPHVAAEYPDAVLVLVGTGGEEARCRAKAGQMGGEAPVVFAGYRTDVARFLSAADVFAFPSLYCDGQSNALLEAMAMGLPIAVSDTPVNRLIISPGVEALGFDGRDPSSVAQAILDLLADRSLGQQLGQAAAARVSRDHDPEQVTQRWIEVYDQLLN